MVETVCVGPLTILQKEFEMFMTTVLTKTDGQISIGITWTFGQIIPLLIISRLHQLELWFYKINLKARECLILTTVMVIHRYQKVLDSDNFGEILDMFQRRKFLFFF